ncbi:MAG: DUF4062 domain-containing protein [Opitutia bacterium]
MTPKVFVSSTIEDLAAIRESVRNLILSLGYTPIMSEYNDFGSTPTESATKACYQAVRKCDVGIVIIAKRYGTKDSISNKSITHNEYLEMRESRIPHFVFIESEVLSYRDVYVKNQGEGSPAIVFPNVDQPDDLFGFIRDVSTSETGNFRIEYDGQNSLCEAIKAQLARHFAELLRDRSDPVSRNIDKLSDELTALRRAVEENKNNNDSRTFLKVSNQLRNDPAKNYRKFLEVICGGFEEGVTSVIKYPTLEDLVAGHSFTTCRIADVMAPEVQNTMRNLAPFYFWSLSPSSIAGFGISTDRKVMITESAWLNFSANHAAAREFTK